MQVVHQVCIVKKNIMAHTNTINYPHRLDYLAHIDDLLIIDRQIFKLLSCSTSDQGWMSGRIFQQ